MTTTSLTPAIRPYDPAGVPTPTPQQQERLARAGHSLAARYDSDGVRRTQPALAAAALVAGLAAPEILAPLGLAAEETSAGAALGAAGRAAAGLLGGAGRSAAGFLGEAARSFLDSSGAAARSTAGTFADPARLGEAAAEFTRSAFVDKAKDAVVIGATAELAHRALGAVRDFVGRHHHQHAGAPPPGAVPSPAGAVDPR
jgi:hypothetical protein